MLSNTVVWNQKYACPMSTYVMEFATVLKVMMKSCVVSGNLFNVTLQVYSALWGMGMPIDFHIAK